MLLLPPLDSLRFFEAAARHQGFARAAEELGVTPAGVAHRVRMLEKYLDLPLFNRRRRGVRLNRRGRAYLKEVQRILAEVHGVSERQRRWPRRVRIVSVEAVAEKWLVPRLASFKAANPGVAIEIETNHRGVDPDSCRSAAPPCWRRAAGPASQPTPPRLATALRSGMGLRLVVLVRPPGPVNPGPVARLGLPPLQHAGRVAVHGIGAAIGRPMLIARELESRTLVPVFDRQAEAPERCCLITTAAARQRAEVRAFREWTLEEAKAVADGA